jgi:hypothetical protein
LSALATIETRQKGYVLSELHELSSYNILRVDSRSLPM